MNKTKFITVRVDESLYNNFNNIIKCKLLNTGAVLRALIGEFITDNTTEEVKAS